MATTFPTSKQTFTAHTDNDPSDLMDAGDVNPVQDTVAAIEDAIGYGTNNGILPAGLTFPNTYGPTFKNSGGTADASIIEDANDDMILSVSDADMFVFKINSVAEAELSQTQLAHPIPRDVVGTGSTPGKNFIQRGFHYITGDGTNNSLNRSIVFPEEFGTTSVVDVIIGLTGRNGSNPTSASSMTTELGTLALLVSVSDITSTGFTARVIRQDAKLASGTRYGFCWIAVGDKA